MQSNQFYATVPQSTVQPDSRQPYRQPQSVDEKLDLLLAQSQHQQVSISFLQEQSNDAIAIGNQAST